MKGLSPSWRVNKQRVRGNMQCGWTEEISAWRFPVVMGALWQQEVYFTLLNRLLEFELCVQNCEVFMGINIEVWVSVGDWVLFIWVWWLSSFSVYLAIWLTPVTVANYIKHITPVFHYQIVSKQILWVGWGAIRDRLWMVKILLNFSSQYEFIVRLRILEEEWQCVYRMNWTVEVRLNMTVSCRRWTQPAVTRNNTYFMDENFS